MGRINLILSSEKYGDHTSGLHTIGVHVRVDKSFTTHDLAAIIANSDTDCRVILHPSTPRRAAYTLACMIGMRAFFNCDFVSCFVEYDGNETLIS